MACIEVQDTGQNSVTLKIKDLATCGFPEDFKHSQKLLKLSPVSERPIYHCKSWNVFQPKISLSQALDETYYSKL